MDVFRDGKTLICVTVMGENRVDGGEINEVNGLSKALRNHCLVYF